MLIHLAEHTEVTNCNNVDCVMSFFALHAHHSDMSVARGMTPDIIFFQFELNGQW